MSKMSELSMILDEMITCGEGMIKAANALKEIFSEEDSPKKAKKEPAKPKAEEAPTKTEEPTYELPDVRKVLAAKSGAGYKAEVKALLAKYGAEKLSEIKPEDYAAVIKEAEVIGNA